MPSRTASGARKSPLFLTIATIGALLFLNIPVLVIFLYAFTKDESTYTFPPSGLTTHWFAVALGRTDMLKALGLSVSVALVATLRG